MKNILLKSYMRIIDLFLFPFTFIIINYTILPVLNQIAFYKKQTLILRRETIKTFIVTFITKKKIQFFLIHIQLIHLQIRRLQVRVFNSFQNKNFFQSTHYHKFWYGEFFANPIEIIHQKTP